MLPQQRRVRSLPRKADDDATAGTMEAVECTTAESILQDGADVLPHGGGVCAWANWIPREGVRDCSTVWNSLRRAAAQLESAVRSGQVHDEHATWRRRRSLPYARAEHVKAAETWSSRRKCGKSTLLLIAHGCCRCRTCRSRRCHDHFRRAQPATGKWRTQKRSRCRLRHFRLRHFRHFLRPGSKGVWICAWNTHAVSALISSLLRLDARNALRRVLRNEYAT
mmetsp:Transcript_15879/g.40341  ORF Transcript_15879/g.40341 Transcript_15879/m.40341 type:complete len:223 (+) Transcript_15879:162-830(+)